MKYPTSQALGRGEGFVVMGFASAAIIFAMLIGGCAQSESAGWAQDSPVLQPDLSPGRPVNLGAKRE